MEFLRARFRRSQEQGFTLIEMAIVLVVIGLILGMVFKGRQLIASAKVKNTNASYNKVIAGMNTFYDRYGLFPGDGCADATDPADDEPTSCNDGTQNGLIDDATEYDYFWDFLIGATNIMSASDRESALGDAWQVAGDTDASWVYVDSGDLRLVCDLDRVADDGDPETGDIRASDGVDATWGGGSAAAYSSGDDCWDLTGTTGVQLRILP